MHLISRATSRVVAGESLRRNEEWLNTASSYSVNVGLTVILLRPFPKFPPSPRGAIPPPSTANEAATTIREGPFQTDDSRTPRSRGCQ